MPFIVIPGSLLEDLAPRTEASTIAFTCFDDGDVYTSLSLGPGERVFGSIRFMDSIDQVDVKAMGNPEDEVRVIVARRSRDGVPWRARGWVRRQQDWEEVEVQALPIREELYSRHEGLFETSVLSEFNVAVIGAGSGGSVDSHNLTGCGIGGLVLVDHDRLEVGNIPLHAAPLSYVGRYKTFAMADVLHEKNPFLKVETHNFRVSWDTEDRVRAIIQRVHAVECAADDPEVWKVINKVCVELNKVCVFGGVFRRAYGGRVHFVEPGKTPCYQCYEMSFPDDEPNEWIDTQARADSIAYSDRPVAVEPGLAIDIRPIGLLMVKLLIQYFLRGKETTLRSLNEDLTAPLYMWLNRRDPESRFADLEPLGFDWGGFHILRWYGIPLKKRADCPVCGNFTKHLAERYGVSLSKGEAEKLRVESKTGRRLD